MLTDSAASQTEKKAKVKAANSKNYKKHKAARIAAVVQYRKEHPDKVQKYYERNWEKHGERYRRERREKRAAAYAADPKTAWLVDTFRAARVRAKKAGLPYDTEIPALPLPDFCPVLGIPLEYCKLSGQGTSGPRPDSPSLDRRMPALGYVATNLKVISNRANTLKSDGTVEELRKVLAYMEGIACAPAFW